MRYSGALTNSWFVSYLKKIYIYIDVNFIKFDLLKIKVKVENLLRSYTLKFLE